jgi:hypothetical protein
MMVALHFSVTIGEDRRLVIDLPPDVPLGPAEITLQAESSSMNLTPSLTEESIAIVLRQAGLLLEPDAMNISESDDIYSDDELAMLAALPPDAKPSHELIDEDRGPR